MINLVIDILKANTTLTNLVSTDNIYPLIQLQGGNIPSVVVQLTNTTPNDTQEKVSTYDDNSVEVTCFAISPAAAWAISEAVRGAIDGYTGGNIAQIRFQSQATDIFESTEVFSVTQGYSVHLKRDGATLPTAIAGLGEFNLDDIADVDASNPSDDQVLTYDAASGTWGPEDASTVAALDDLTDVTIDDPIDRQVLAYDEATGGWINDGAGSISIPVYNNSINPIAKGRALTAVGSQGDRIKVEPYAQIYGGLRFVGIAGEEIPGRSNGHATVYGEIRGLDTSNFQVGTLLYPVDTIHSTFFPFGLASWAEGTNTSPLVCAMVTRQQQNTGRIFVRMWSPGYRNTLDRLDDVRISSPFEGALLRYDADQSEWRVPPQTSKSILEGATETVEIYYYSITTDTQQFRSAQSDTPSAGNKIVRKIWYSTTAQADIDSGDWTLLETLDDDATYDELVTAFENQLKTSPGGDTPVSIKTTWEDVPAFTGLLDTYPGAAAAYSLRLLDTDYTGSAIRVRRASDNAEQDIGFDGNGDLDTTSLATFCSGTDGFVKTWYDQSGNTNDATQTTTGNQPKIYDSATGVVTENGKPAAQFDGTDDKLLNTSLTANSRQDVFYVRKGVNDGNRQSVLGFPTTDADTQIGIYYHTINTAYGFNTWSGDLYGIGSATSVLTSQNLEYAVFLNGNPATSGVQLYINGTSQSLSQVTGTSVSRTMANGFRIATGGNSAGSQDFNGTIQEIIIYPSDQSTNRTGIESNINAYYNIF